MSTSTEPAKLVHCSFCGKNQHQVELIIAAEQAWICDECTVLAVNTMMTERPGLFVVRFNKLPKVVPPSVTSADKRSADVSDRQAELRKILEPFITDENYIPNRYGIIDVNCRDYSDGADLCGCYESFDEAMCAWDSLCDKDPKGNYAITGWGHGVLARHDQIERLFARPRGTFECSICGQEIHHDHTEKEIITDRKLDKVLQKQYEEERAEILSRVANVEKCYGRRKNLDSAVTAVLAVASVLAGSSVKGEQT